MHETYISIELFEITIKLLIVPLGSPPPPANVFYPLRLALTLQDQSAPYLTQPNQILFMGISPQLLKDKKVYLKYVFRLSSTLFSLRFHRIGVWLNEILGKGE